MDNIYSLPVLKIVKMVQESTETLHNAETLRLKRLWKMLNELNTQEINALFSKSERIDSPLHRHNAVLQNLDRFINQHETI